MAGGVVTISVEDREVRQMLQQIAQRLTNLRPAMAEIGEIVLESVQRNFEEHRSPEGVPWTPLSPSYAAWKARRGRNLSDILILKGASGGLMGSLHRKVESDRVTIGTNVVYAAIHQFGGKTGRKHAAQMPARPYLGVRAEDWSKIRLALERYLAAK